MYFLALYSRLNYGFKRFQSVLVGFDEFVEFGVFKLDAMLGLLDRSQQVCTGRCGVWSAAACAVAAMACDFCSVVFRAGSWLQNTACALTAFTGVVDFAQFMQSILVHEYNCLVRLCVLCDCFFQLFDDCLKLGRLWHLCVSPLFFVYVVTAERIELIITGLKALCRNHLTTPPYNDGVCILRYRLRFVHSALGYSRAEDAKSQIQFSFAVFSVWFWGGITIQP